MNGRNCFSIVVIAAYTWILNLLQSFGLWLLHLLRIYNIYRENIEKKNYLFLPETSPSAHLFSYLTISKTLETNFKVFVSIVVISLLIRESLIQKHLCFLFGFQNCLANRVVTLANTLHFFCSEVLDQEKILTCYCKNGIFISGITEVWNLMWEMSLSHSVHLKPEFWKVECWWDSGDTS